MFANNDFMVIIEEVKKPFDKLFESLNDSRKIRKLYFGIIFFNEFLVLQIRQLQFIIYEIKI